MWIGLTRLEEHASVQTIIKARSVLEKARLRNPRNAVLWLESIRLELRANQKQVASAMLSRALQELPDSGHLWAESIFMEERPRRRARAVDALRKCEHDPHVLIASAKLFWIERRFPKVREWLAKALKVDSDLGDTWAWLYKVETEHGTTAAADEVIRKCSDAEPRHGDAWTAVSKDIRNWKCKTAEILKLVSQSLAEPV